MTPVRRFIAGTCLLLAIATAGLWVRGRGASDGLLLFGPGGRMQVLAAGKGRLRLFISNIEFGPERAWTMDVAHGSLEEMERLVQLLSKPGNPSISLGPLGLTGQRTNAFAMPGQWFLFATVPHWLPIGLFCIPPLLAARIRLRQWQRKRNGLCLNCGYDLRGSPEGCPECGAGRVDAAIGRAGHEAGLWED